MAKRNLTRDELKKEFAAELYVAGSFFKMKRFSEGDKFTPLKELDVRVQRDSGAIAPMGNPKVTHRFIPDREPMPKIKPAHIEHKVVTPTQKDINAKKAGMKYKVIFPGTGGYLYFETREEIRPYSCFGNTPDQLTIVEL